MMCVFSTVNLPGYRIHTITTASQKSGANAIGFTLGFGWAHDMRITGPKIKQLHLG